MTCSVLRFALFWNFAHLRMVVAWGSFVTTYRSNLHGRSSPRRKIDPWIWNRQVVPKRRYETTILCCVKFQNNANLIYTAVEAWYHACAVLFPCIHFCPLEFSVFWPWYCVVWQLSTKMENLTCQVFISCCANTVRQGRAECLICLSLHLVVPSRTSHMSPKKKQLCPLSCILKC